MSIKKSLYGVVKDKEIYLYTFENANGIKVEVINYGGIIRAIYTPDENGEMADIVLGYDTLEQYTQNTPYFGAIVGRCANVIEKGELKIDDTVYKLSLNEGKHHQHGGVHGFHKAVWDAEILGESEYLQLSYQSHDGEEGYPGNLSVKIRYSLREDNSFCIDYFAVSDKGTAINMTNHTYFNLKGHKSGDITNHQLKINGEKILEIDHRGLPVGKVCDVKGSIFDFSTLKNIGQNLISDNEQIVWGKGYDHHFILGTQRCESETAVEVREPERGRCLMVYTTLPGVQLYTGNYLDPEEIGKAGCRYRPWDGFCLETQYCPNAFKNNVEPLPLFKRGDEYRHMTIYKFGVCR